MPDLEDLLALVGVASLTAGVGLVYVPAALVVFGVLLLTASVLRSRS